MVEALLRLDEVADALGVSEQTVRRLISDGEIPVCRVGKSVRVEPSALKGWVDRGGVKQGDRRR